MGRTYEVGDTIQPEPGSSVPTVKVIHKGIDRVFFTVGVVSVRVVTEYVASSGPTGPYRKAEGSVLHARAGWVEVLDGIIVAASGNDDEIVKAAISTWELAVYAIGR